MPQRSYVHSRQQYQSLTYSKQLVCSARAVHPLYTRGAGFTHAQLALQLNLTLGQVKYPLAYRITP